MNLITGTLAMLLYLSITLNVGSRVVAQFRDNSISQDSGLAVGDEIVRINGENMISYNDVMYKIMFDGCEPLELTVIRDGETVVLKDVVFPTEEVDGVEYGVADFLFQGVRPTISVLLRQTMTQSVATVKVIYKSLAELITGRFGIRGVLGPVGTVSVISEAAKTGFSSVVYLFSFISLNLGIMNLLPIPALDGGRLLFLLVEAVRRKPLDPRLEGYVNLAGMVLLLAFMAIVTVIDVIKLV